MPNRDLKATTTVSLRFSLRNQAEQLCGKANEGMEFTTFTALMETAISELIESRLKTGNDDQLQIFRKEFTDEKQLFNWLVSIGGWKRDSTKSSFDVKNWQFKDNNGPLFNTQAINFSERCVKGLIDYLEGYTENLNNYLKAYRGAK